jgi:hypothetical protein
MKKYHFVILIIIYNLFGGTAIAGPPFFTDDPQPVDFKHWEFYMASQMDFMQKDADLTLPHFEMNYGVIPEVQLHIIVPLGYVRTEAGSAYGYRDTELGIKLRVINTEDSLMIGVFPLGELPTGNADKQLGNGKLQLFLPLWIQKSWGHFQTYFGTGYWINPGSGNKNYIFAGWQAQYDITSTFTFGAEVYYRGADSQFTTSTTGFNFGGYINLSEKHHILFSLGKSFSLIDYTAYLGYQMTI